MAKITGFILGAVWNDSFKHDIVFTIVSASERFEVRINNTEPLFFIENHHDCSHVKNITEKSISLDTLGHVPVKALYFKNQKSLVSIKDELRSQGIRTFESDVLPYERYLMERFIFGGVEIEGSFNLVSGKKVFDNPQMRPVDYNPEFRILSLDIETGQKGELYSIGLHLTYAQEERKIVLMVGDFPSENGDFELNYFSNELNLLKYFFKIFSELDADIIIGWHVIGFDFKFIKEKCFEYGLKFSLGRNGEEAYIDSRKSGSWFARIHGRVVMDGPPMLRGAFYKFDSFKLDFVARELLGVGKDIQQSGAQKVAEIERRFAEDKKSLAYYNLQDCTLVTDIFNKTKLVNLSIRRTQISGMLFDRIGSSVGAFDYFYLPLLHRRGFVAPDKLDVEIGEQSAGGHVLEPKVGLHKDVIVLDFKSLYPSIIRTFKIDPLSLANSEVDTIKTPVDINFSGSMHILPEQIEKLMELRAQAKEEGNSTLSQAIKILMNSFYGVMGSSGCRFYNRNLPTAITGIGHYVLKKSIEFFEESGYEVIYGDTDSVFVKVTSVKRGETIDDIAQYLAKEGSIFLARLLKLDYKVDSHLELEYEKHYLKFFLPSLRHGSGGAKKRYAGLVQGKFEKELFFAGLEVVRSDWTVLAKNFQRELFRRLFFEEEIASWIKEFVIKLKNGSFTEELLYKKKLTKPLEEYVKSQPPHVKAASLLFEKGLLNTREIEYYITRRGPVPKELDHDDIDYGHYIEKQIKPLADMILPILDLSFNELIEGDQLSLF